MGSSWLVLVMVAAIFVSMVLLAVVCLDCRVKGPPSSISQTNASDVYVQSSNFIVISPSQRDMYPSHPHSDWLPFPHSVDGGPQQRPVTPTDTESNLSSDNPGDGPDYENQTDNGYILVLPQPKTPSPSPSRASSQSSDAHDDYVNVPVESKDYLNVEPLQRFPSASTSAQSESSDDDGGNYVNQPPLTHIQSSA